MFPLIFSKSLNEMPTSPFFDLVNALSLPTYEKFAAFKIFKTSYKSLVGHPSGDIYADVLVPKGLLNLVEPTKRPVIVRIHGGFLVRHIPFHELYLYNPAH